MILHQGRLGIDCTVIAQRLLETPLSNYTNPFRALYDLSRQQLSFALKHYQEIDAGGKYLNKLPKGQTPTEGKALAQKRLVRQVEDTLRMLKPEAKAALLKSFSSLANTSPQSLCRTQAPQSFASACG